MRYLGPGAVVRSLAGEGKAPEGIRPRRGDRLLVVEEPTLPDRRSAVVREPLYLGLDRAVLWEARPVEQTGWELRVSDFGRGVVRTRTAVVAAPTPEELDLLMASWGWTPRPGPDETAYRNRGRTWITATYLLAADHPAL